MESVLDPSVGVVGASTLSIGSSVPGGDKVSVGCLLKIEVSSTQQVRITARTTVSSASAPLVEVVKALLLLSAQA